MLLLFRPSVGIPVVVPVRDPVRIEDYNERAYDQLLGRVLRWPS